MFHHSVDTCAVVVRVLLDAHLGWSGPSRVNNKQASYHGHYSRLHGAPQIPDSAIWFVLHDQQISKTCIE